MNTTTKSHQWNIVLILAIVLLSALPSRLWHLTASPPVMIDEPANLRDIRKLIAEPGFHPTDFAWDYSQGALVHYPTIFLIRFWVDNWFLALRLTSVMLSILTLIPFFCIVKKYMSILVAASTTLLFSSSYYFLQFSRVGWTNIHALTLGLYFLWIMVEASERKSLFFASLAGVLGGLVFYVYRAGELYIAFGSLYFLVAIGKSRQSKEDKFLLFWAYFVIMASVAFPWIYTILHRWTWYTLREHTVSIFSVPLPYHGFNNAIDIFRYQIGEAIRSWVLFLPMYSNNQENIRYLPIGYGAISFGNVILFWIGCLAALKNSKRSVFWFFLYGTGIVTGQILTVDPPNGARALLFLPIIYLFIAHGLQSIRSCYQKGSRIGSAVVVAIALTLSILDLSLYAHWMTWIPKFP